MTLVAVIDDDPTVRRIVASYLQRDGFSVFDTGSGSVALSWLLKNEPDAVVLDIMLPGVDGLGILQALREVSDVPVILLTALGAEDDRVRGLVLGADDYLVKPFSPRELVARITNMTARRQTATPTNQVVVSPPFRLDTAARQLWLDDVVVDLTPKEFDLTTVLIANPRQAFSRDELLATVWQSTATWQGPATVTVHMGRIRQKVEVRPQHPRFFVTVRSKGYRFDP